MYRSIIISVMLSVLFIGGCAPQEYWAQSGVTLEQCKKDHAECLYLLPSELKGLQWSGEPSRRFVEECMRQRGYEIYVFDALPSSVKRAEVRKVQVFISEVLLRGWAGE